MYATRKKTWRGWGGLAPTPEWGGRAGRVARTIQAGGLGAFLAGDGLGAFLGDDADKVWANTFAALKLQHEATLRKAQAAGMAPVPTPAGVGTRARKAAARLAHGIVPTATTLPLSPSVLDVAALEKVRRAAQVAADLAAGPLVLFGMSPMMLVGVAGLVVGVMALRGRGGRSRRRRGRGGRSRRRRR